MKLFLTLALLTASNLLSSASLLHTQRPPEVQAAIDETFAGLQRHSPSSAWRHDGSGGVYNLMLFDEMTVIKQRIAKARSQHKEALYLIDFGAGNMGWVDNVASVLETDLTSGKLQISSSTRTLHIIGVTGEPRARITCTDEGSCAEHFQEESVVGDVKIIRHKICSFKLENLLEEFQKLGLNLQGQVEYAVCAWTLQHLVDPLGTLDQIHSLLTPGNGLMMGTSWMFGDKQKAVQELDDMLKTSFGIWDYLIMPDGDQRTLHFALWMPSRGEGAYYDAGDEFAYGGAFDLGDTCGPIDSKACKRVTYVSLKPLRLAMDGQHRRVKTLAEGVPFVGFSTWILEKLLGHGYYLVEVNFREVRGPFKLFGDSYSMWQPYIASYVKRNKLLHAAIQDAGEHEAKL